MTDLTKFDSEPEDGWDADDSIIEQVDNIRRRIRLLRDNLGPIATQHEQTRFKNLDIDLAFIVQRLIDG